MFDIVTFGSVSFDTLLKVKRGGLKIEKNKNSISKKEIVIPLGLKLEIGELETFIGGGGTNTAFTFHFQGLKTAYVGKVGRDEFGKSILNYLKKYKLHFLIKEDHSHKTEYSVIISSKGGEKTIFVFRGAASFLSSKEIPWGKIKSRWFYVAPLSGNLMNLFKKIVNFTRENNIKLAVNPSLEQISLFKSKPSFRSLLKKIDVLILNREEASLMTKEGKIRKVLRELIKMTNEKIILVVTEGKKGALVYHNDYLYKSNAPSVRPIDKTGAGDAFGSGFLVGLLRKNDIRYAMKLATSNATSCILKPGAKNGLLKKGQKLYPVEIKKYKVKW